MDEMRRRELGWNRKSGGESAVVKGMRGVYNPGFPADRGDGPAVLDR